MSIEGRINIDALFYDMDGDESLKVVSLSGATEYAAGVVNSVTKTVSVGTSVIPVNEYINASGSVATINQPTILVFKHSGSCVVKQIDDIGGYALRVVPPPDSVVVIPVNPDYPIQVQTIGAGTYTAVIYGET